MYCNQCGKQIPDNSKFCQECGCELSKSIATPEHDGQNLVNKEVKEIPLYVGHVAVSKQKMDEIEFLIESNVLPVAVKIVRELSGLSLEDANNFVENFYFIDKTKPQNTFEKNISNAALKDLENIPMPKIGLAILYGIIAILSLIIGFITIKESFFAFICSLIAFFYLWSVCSNTVKDYNLAKKDFSKYQEKVLKKRESEKAQKEAEQNKQKEYEAKRREYRGKGIPTCPKCGSHSIATINRGYSIVSGFIGSGKPVNVCQICGYKWKIGK